MIDLNALGDECKVIADKRGFYHDKQGFDDLMQPLFSEIKEARDAYLQGNYTGDKDSLDIEFTDMLFTVLSIGRKLKIDFNHNAKYKLEYNKIRSDRYKGTK
jgi:NTP pyrophosphatase (non-canonical NTP hydrolase)